MATVSSFTTKKNREDDDPAEDDDPKERAWLEDPHASITPPADWGRAWNASVGSEDDEAGDEDAEHDGREPEAAH